MMELPPFLIPFDIATHLDEDAVAACLNMLERNVPPSDILLLAFSPASQLLQDTTPQDNLILDSLIQRYMGNPNVNQDELMKLDWSRKLGESLANQVILPKDQVEAVAIEATRQQIIELQSIVAGQEIPVSPRDNDVVHLDTMTEKLMPVIASAPAGSLPPEAIAPLTQALAHYNNHVQAAEAKGVAKDVLQKYKQAMSQALKHLSAGQAQPMPQDVAPAASGGMGAPRVPVAQEKLLQTQYEAVTPNQMGVIDQAANPPRPSTAN
jgi:hypothetical protein